MDSDEMKLVKVWGANKLGGPFAEIRVKPEYAERADFLVVLDDGQQLDHERLGIQETTVELYVSEGEQKIIGIEGGQIEDGVVVNGDQIIHAALYVDVVSR